MKLYVKFVIYIFLIFLQVYFDQFVYKCKTYKGKILIIIHHILQIYSIFGSLIFKQYYLHTFSLLFAFISHLILKKCFVTQIQNKWCEFDDNVKLETFLNHVIKILNIDYTNNIYYTLLICVILYNFYNILKNDYLK